MIMHIKLINFLIMKNNNNNSFLNDLKKVLTEKNNVICIKHIYLLHKKHQLLKLILYSYFLFHCIHQQLFLL